jgi:hypothetical protein
MFLGLGYVLSMFFLIYSSGKSKDGCATTDFPCHQGGNLDIREIQGLAQDHIDKKW